LFGSFAIAFDPRGWGKLGPIAVAIIVALNIHAGVTVSGKEFLTKTLFLVFNKQLIIHQALQ